MNSRGHAYPYLLDSNLQATRRSLRPLELGDSLNVAIAAHLLSTGSRQHIESASRRLHESRAVEHNAGFCTDSDWNSGGNNKC